MYIEDGLLDYDELLTLKLRSLFTKGGWKRFKLSKFESYDFYADNRAFINAENILSFTDTNGKLMALKPDVTLSVVNALAIDTTTLSKVYYRENVYRANPQTKRFKELVQIGVESLGKVDKTEVANTLCLAAQSLAAISPAYMLVLTSMDVMSELLNESGFKNVDKSKMLEFIASKNRSSLSRYCSEKGVTDEAIERLNKILNLPREGKEALEILSSMGFSQGALAPLQDTYSSLEREGFAYFVRIDFSLTNDPAYYNGIAFQGFIEGASEAVLTGGQYDKLIAKLGKVGASIGFAVYLDNIPEEVLAKNYSTVDVNVSAAGNADSLSDKRVEQ